MHPIKQEPNVVPTPTTPPHVILSSDDDEPISQNDKQIVLYNPTTTNENYYENPPNSAVVPLPEFGAAPDPISYRIPGAPAPRILPAVGAFTVQCVKCFKWRIIPSKEKYEEIREHIVEWPFECERAREWKDGVSCDDPTDLEQDGSRLWAMDKPSISQAPPGWERELRIRGQGSSKFADVYYISPTGKRLRSMVEIHKYLMEYPDYIRQGVTLSQFSFQIPKPLQENYVRKRTARYGAPFDETIHVSPLSWAAPDDASDLPLNEPGPPPASYSREIPTHRVHPPAKKKRRSSSEHVYSNQALHDHLDEPGPLASYSTEIPTRRVHSQAKKKPRSSSEHVYRNPALHDHLQRFKIKGPRQPPNDVYDF